MARTRGAEHGNFNADKAAKLRAAIASLDELTDEELREITAKDLFLEAGYSATGPGVKTVFTDLLEEEGYSLHRWKPKIRRS